MNFSQKGVICFCCVAIPLIMAYASHTAIAQDKNAGNITPTNIYDLAKSIDDSLISMYGLTSAFQKKRLSNNIRPRNSYQKLLSVANEFNLLHGNVINPARLDAARKMDTLATTPRDLHKVLSLIRDHLVAENKFVEVPESKTLRTPSDVTHLLRQISFHHIEIAKKKNVTTNWSTPDQVYEAVMKDILPVVMGVADEIKLEYKAYPFPRQPEREVLPLNISKLLQHLYKNISEYYKNKGWYDPLVLIKLNECDDISPGDSFDLIKAISAEFKAMSGNKRLDMKILEQYNAWKSSKDKIVPGDVYRLLQYNYILSKRSLRNKGP